MRRSRVTRESLSIGQRLSKSLQEAGISFVGSSRGATRIAGICAYLPRGGVRCHVQRQPRRANCDDPLAALEVATHDESLSDATGMPSPVFGAYADAEAKLRSLNDLVRSFTLLLASPDVHMGQIIVARAAIETAARMQWGLAVD